MMLFAPLSQGILTAEDNEDITYTSLMTTSSSSFAMQDYQNASTATPGDGDPTGSFKVGVAAESASTGARVV